MKNYYFKADLVYKFKKIDSPIFLIYFKFFINNFKKK